MLLALAPAACHREPDARPSVLLISLDTLRADRLNAYGYTRRTTSPALDALARDSVLFERHLAASPWTTPSHMSLLTALSPSRHGVTPDYATLIHVHHTNGLPAAADRRYLALSRVIECFNGTVWFEANPILWEVLKEHQSRPDVEPGKP